MTTRSRVFDCFMFHDEVELLELRLHTLRDVVDTFVLVEGDRTHSGLPKASIFATVAAQFRDFPIVHHIATLPPPDPDRWLPERIQRNAMAVAIAPFARPGDWVLLSDVDEIPHPAHVRAEGVHQMAGFMYYLNCRYFEDAWFGTMSLPYEAVLVTTPFGLRHLVGTRRDELPMVRSGWHFSYQGGVARMQTKLRSFAHAEFDTPAHHAQLEAQMTALADPLGRSDALHNHGQVLPLDHTFPVYLREHPERFAHMLAPVPA